MNLHEEDEILLSGISIGIILSALALFFLVILVLPKIVSSSDYELLQQAKSGTLQIKESNQRYSEGFNRATTMCNELYVLDCNLGYIGGWKCDKLIPKPQPKAETPIQTTVDENVNVFGIKGSDNPLRVDGNFSIREKQFSNICFTNKAIMQEQSDYWEVYLKTEIPAGILVPSYWRFHKELYLFNKDLNCFEAK